MSTYLITWKPGPTTPVERSITVQAASMVAAAELAHRKIYFSYPNYQLTGVQLVSRSYITDAELERARAEQ